MLYPLSYEGWPAGFSERVARGKPHHHRGAPLAAQDMLATVHARVGRDHASLLI